MDELDRLEVTVCSECGAKVLGNGLYVTCLSEMNIELGDRVRVSDKHGRIVKANDGDTINWFGIAVRIHGDRILVRIY